MNISLSPETQKLLEEQMRKRHFSSPDEAMRAALHSLDESAPVLDYENLAPETRETIEESEQQCERGEGLPWKQVRADILSGFAGK